MPASRPCPSALACAAGTDPVPISALPDVVFCRSISNRNIPSTYDIQLTQQVSVAGFSGIWPSGPRGGQLGAQATKFVPPCLMTHKIVSESRGFESMVVVYAGRDLHVDTETR